MKKSRITTFLAALSVCAAALSFASGASAYTPSKDTLKVGLRYGSDALESANLENEVGEGYRFGYFDSDRDFISLGAETSKSNISVIRDSNMYLVGSNYYVGTGTTMVGCVHIRFNTAYSSFEAASSAAAAYNNSFVRYENGSYYAMSGNYTSADAASADAVSRGLSDYVIDSGTSYTLTVVETGTTTILFEFDCGTDRYLGVAPKSASSKAQTWFKGYCYYGGFQYARLSGGNITVVNIVGLEDYVKGVIPYEMSASWPVEALKAQACCARTYAINCFNADKHGEYGFDICNTTHCQVYYGTGSANSNSDSAVDGTAGKFVTYNGSLCQTVYSSSDGGGSESAVNVWGNDFGYLKGVLDPYEADIADIAGNYKWSVSYTASELASMLSDMGYLPSGAVVTDLVVSSYSDTGNAIGVKVYYNNSSGDAKTVTFSGGSKINYVFDTNSIRFKITTDAVSGDGDIYVNSSESKLDNGLNGVYAEGSGGTAGLGSGDVYALTGSGETELIGGRSESPATEFTLTGTGWGHSVGMSQWGAYSMAKNYGKTYEEILKFYYTGVTIG